MKIYVETHRLILREIEEYDVEGMFELDSDPEVHRYLGKKPIQSLKEAEKIINYVRNQYKNDGLGRWAVVDKNTDEFMGWAGLKFEREVRTDMDYYDLGYRLKKKFWGQGIATEASAESLRYGFETLGLTEIFAGAEIENIGSNKVLQKVGMTRLETFEFDNEPHHWYRITRDEWKEKSND